jgi:hypothetical protein
LDFSYFSTDPFTAQKITGPTTVAVTLRSLLAMHLPRFLKLGTRRKDPRLIQNGEEKMGLAAYTIVGSGGEWRIRHDGKDENVYQTKESAFEAAVAAASLALRQGHEVQISAPGSDTATAATNEG